MGAELSVTGPSSDVVWMKNGQRYGQSGEVAGSDDVEHVYMVPRRRSDQHYHCSHEAEGHCTREDETKREARRNTNHGEKLQMRSVNGHSSVGRIAAEY